MEIYVEYVVIDNLVINYIILFLVAKILQKQNTFLRLALASVFGLIFSLIFPLFSVSNFFLIPLKLLVGVFMVLIAFGFKSVKKFFLEFFLFLTSTAVMGGMCFFVLFLFSSSKNSLVLSSYDLPVPMGLVFFVLFIYVFLIFELIGFFKKRKKFEQFVFSVEFFSENKSFKTNAFLDTGNTLCDPVTLKPVVIVNFKTFQKLFDIPIENLLSKSVLSKIHNSHYIDFDTISNSKKQILVFEIPKIEIQMQNEKIVKSEIMLGLSFANFSKLQECNALLNPALF